jgi:hypothetical protein
MDILTSLVLQTWGWFVFWMVVFRGMMIDSGWVFAVEAVDYWAATAAEHELGFLLLLGG